MKWLCNWLQRRRERKAAIAAACAAGRHVPLQRGEPWARGLCEHCGHDTYADEANRLLAEWHRTHPRLDNESRLP